MARTRDGIRLRDVIRTLAQIGIVAREATNHPFVLNYPNMRPCPLAESTDVQRMVVPWVRQAMGYNGNRIYNNIRNGEWR